MPNQNRNQKIKIGFEKNNLRPFQARSASNFIKPAEIKYFNINPFMATELENRNREIKTLFK
jgi:hypothetical protein